MQHDNVLKKLHIVLITPYPESGCGGEGGGLRGYHVAAFVILFNLILGWSRSGVHRIFHCVFNSYLDIG